MAILILPIFPAHAQHFDWVKTYTGPDLNGSETNNIVGSFVDAEGNFYFLGEFSPSATLCGVRLLPEEVVSGQYRSVVIAKLSPSGQLQWHKAIYGPQNSYAFSLCPMGDTAFMVMVGFCMSHNFNSYLYYLDTLLTSSDSGHLQSPSNSTSYLTNGLITFGHDGEVIDQHFLEVGYTDNDGHILTMNTIDRNNLYPESIRSNILSSQSFNIDMDGNIYILRSMNGVLSILCDTCLYGTQSLSVANGTISAINVIVDGINIYTFNILVPTATWNQQIIKFSPHFETIINAITMFDSTITSSSSSTSLSAKSITFDPTGNMHINVIGANLPQNLPFTNSNSLHFKTDNLTRPACIIKYDTALNPLSVFQLWYSSDSSDMFPKRFDRLRPFFDTTSNSMFMLGSVQLAPNYTGTNNCMIMYGNDTLNIQNNAFWIRFDFSNHNILSYGKALSSVATYIDGADEQLSIFNGRLFTQLRYWTDIRLNDSTSYESNPRGMGVMWWDFDGHPIGYLDFQANGTYDQPGQTLIQDSTLYLTGRVMSGAQFGDISIPNGGKSTAYIARYIDTTFLNSYIAKNEQSIDWIQTLSFLLSTEPIRLTAIATSGLPITYSIEDTTIAIIRNDTLILLSEGVTQITASQSGNSAFYPAEPVTRLLQVGRESVDVSNESKIHIYPNPAKDVLYFVCDETTISEITVLSSDGRMTKLPYNSNSIDISTLSTGIYYLVIVSEHEVYKHKIVKL